MRRNIKAFTQVVWYPLYLIVATNPQANRDLDAIVKTMFYLSKIGYKLYNEASIIWSTYMTRVLREAIQKVAAFFKRRMESILQYHLLEDLVRHGNPASYDCSTGESKMRVQKL